MTQHAPPYMTTSTLPVDVNLETGVNCKAEPKPVDLLLTTAEWNMLRRLRQLRNRGNARKVLLDLVAMTLEIVGKEEQLGSD